MIRETSFQGGQQIKTAKCILHQFTFIRTRLYSDNRQETQDVPAVQPSEERVSEVLIRKLQSMMPFQHGNSEVWMPYNRAKRNPHRHGFPRIHGPNMFSHGFRCFHMFSSEMHIVQSLETQRCQVDSWNSKKSRCAYSIVWQSKRRTAPLCHRNFSNHKFDIKFKIVQVYHCRSAQHFFGYVSKLTQAQHRLAQCFSSQRMLFGDFGGLCPNSIIHNSRAIAFPPEYPECSQHIPRF